MRSATALALAATLTAGGARAQPFAPQGYPPPAYAAPPVVPVQIEGAEPNSSIVVLIQGGEYQCGQRCALSLAPGAYNLRVTDAEGNLSRENLYVQAPTRAVVTPANRTARIVGLSLMGAAVAGAFLGAIGLVKASGIQSRACDPYFPEPNCEAMADEKAGPWLYASAIGLGAALAFGFTGFYLWDQNTTAGIQLAPLGGQR